LSTITSTMAGSAAIVLVIVLNVIGLAREGLNIAGHALCLGVPPVRDGSLKGLAVAAFALIVASVVGTYAIQLFNWVRFGMFFGGFNTNPFAVLGGSGVVVAVGGLAGLAGIAGFLVFLFFMRGVCLAVRQPGLAQTIQSYLIAVGITFGISVLLSIIMFVIVGTAFFTALGGGMTRGAANAFGASMFVAMGLGCLLALVGLALFIWYIVILHQVRAAIDTYLRRH
jgi:hypothetical protein